MSKKQITRRAQDFGHPCSPLQTPTVRLAFLQELVFVNPFVFL
jgi:hypothetical protein